MIYWFMVLMVAYPVAMTTAPVDNEHESETPEAQGNSLQNTNSLSFRPAPHDGFETDDAFLQEMGARVDALIERAKAASPQRDRIDLWLATANLILASQLEPSCSRVLLGIDLDHVKERRAEDHAVLDRASKLLDEARTALKDFMAAPENDDDFVMIRQQRLDMLSAFHNAIHAYLLNEDGEEVMQKRRDAASELSAFMEDPDRHLVDAAQLWHALLRRSETDRRAILALLDPVVSEAAQPVSSHELFGRLMRCELIAERGGFAAALALLIQLEERAHVWQFAGADREDAIRLIAHRQIRILEQWKAALTADNSDRERTWCDDQVQSLMGEHFIESRQLLRLGLAIPIICSDPDVPEATPRKPPREE